MINSKIKKLEVIGGANCQEFIDIDDGGAAGWESIKDIDDSNIDVSVTLDTGQEFVFTVSTPKNFITLMKEDNDRNFFDGFPMVVVKKLTYDIVFETLTEFLQANNGYLFKLYLLTGYGINDDELAYLLKQHNIKFDN